MTRLDPWIAFETAVAGGDEKAIRRAFEDVYHRVNGEMVRFAQWCARQHNPDLVPGFVLDPEEVVEDAFLQLLLSCRTIRNKKNWVLGYIKLRLRYKIAAALDENKEKAEAQRQLQRLLRPGKVRSSLDPEAVRAVRHAVLTLPKQMRRVIIALYYKEESVATLAVRLQVTENAVVQARRRALRKLKGLVR